MPQKNVKQIINNKFLNEPDAMYDAIVKPIAFKTQTNNF